MDDTGGQCGGGVYPLLHAVSDVFNSNTDNSARMKKKFALLRMKFRDLILVTKTNNNPQSQLKQKNVFCSVSSKADESSGLNGFTLETIDPNLCTHLLIGSGSSLLTASISDRLKTANPDLKILLTFDADERRTMDQWKEELKKKNTDGINIHIDSNAVSDRIMDLIKVFSFPSRF